MRAVFQGFLRLFLDQEEVKLLCAILCHHYQANEEYWIEDRLEPVYSKVKKARDNDGEVALKLYSQELRALCHLFKRPPPTFSDQDLKEHSQHRDRQAKLATLHNSLYEEFKRCESHVTSRVRGPEV